MTDLHWTEEEYLEYIKRFVKKGRAIKAAVDLAISATHAQRNEALQRAPADQSNQVDKKFRVRITHQRRRTVDRGGIDYKPAVDGFRPAGIWPDDNPKYVEEITEVYKQGPDETILEIWEIERK
jgi:hypothetical protein